jgi:hypothetical protein
VSHEEVLFLLALYSVGPFSLSLVFTGLFLQKTSSQCEARTEMPQALLTNKNKAKLANYMPMTSLRQLGLNIIIIIILIFWPKSIHASKKHPNHRMRQNLYYLN